MFTKFLLLILFLFTIVHSQQIDLPGTSNRQSSVDTEPFSTLTLELLAPSREVLQLQPIPVVLRQSNRTNAPAFGYNSLSFGHPIFIYLKKAGTANPAKMIELSTLLKLTRHKVVAIHPGSTVEASGWLTLGLKKYFHGPGVYELYALLANPERTEFIRSDPITIEVREPIGTDRLAYNLIANSPFEDDLFSGAEFEKVQPVLESLRTRYPRTSYGRSAAFLLGETYFHDKQYARALANLVILENDNGYIFAEKVREYLTEIRRQMSEQ